MTIKKIVEFRSLKELSQGELRQLADLHSRTIPYSINAQLGPAHLFEVYKIFQMAKGIQSVVAVSGFEVIGCAIASTPDTNFNKISRKLRLKIIKKFLNPIWAVRNVINIADYIFLTFMTFRLRKTSGYLELWFVGEATKGSGIGSEILTQVFKNLKTTDQKRIGADTRKFSGDALRAYGKLGFKVRGTSPISILLVRSL